MPAKLRYDYIFRRQALSGDRSIQRTVLLPLLQLVVLALLSRRWSLHQALILFLKGSRRRP